MIPNSKDSLRNHFRRVFLIFPLDFSVYIV